MIVRGDMLATPLRKAIRVSDTFGACDGCIEDLGLLNGYSESFCFRGKHSQSGPFVLLEAS